MAHTGMKNLEYEDEDEDEGYCDLASAQAASIVFFCLMWPRNQINQWLYLCCSERERETQCVREQKRA